ncbi:uncharacterized protein LOC135344129 [Halichondria panicea]|uniref:uncharacterized protein LOC135344129 n=1 Tax=Halichondria panicea TaxID=6063 RepID=UPI00312B54F0
MSSIEYKLCVKASPDGKSLGDCPFTQRANLAFKVKKVPVTYTLIELSKKPQWFLALTPGGSVPVLQYGDTVNGDSYEIVQYLDATYPEPSLKPPGNEEAEKATGDIFNKFSAWAKHFKDPNAQEAKDAFVAEMKKVDDFVSKSGPLLCGSPWSVADCALVPRLYHMQTVADHFMGYKIDQFNNVKRYMDYSFATEEFKQTDYPREWILTGWAKYFK